MSMPSDGEGIDVLTPGHFLIGRPLEALPDPPSSLQAELLFGTGTCARLLLDIFGGDGLLTTSPACKSLRSGIPLQGTSRLTTCNVEGGKFHSH